MDSRDTRRDRKLFAYQWLPTRQELKRGRYPQKEVDGFSHPYIFEGEPPLTDYPLGETGPAEYIYTTTVGARSGRASRNEPLELTETILRAKLRDGFRCEMRNQGNLCPPHQRHEVAPPQGPGDAVSGLSSRGTRISPATNDRMESRMRRKSHVRFGESGANRSEQSRYGGLSLLYATQPPAPRMSW